MSEVPAGPDVVSTDPWTGEVVFSVPAATPADVTGAVARADGAAAGWAATPVADRAAALRAFADLVEVNARRLEELIVAEVGKRRVDALGEVEWTALSARWYADHPPVEERAGGARVVRRPLGVIAAVTPWNVPLITPAWKWLPALMAGNAVVWKPSERTTAVALAARDMLVEAGVPEDVLVVLAGGAPVARALCADDRVAGIHFTGSEGAGRALAELGAPRFARCALEMSGLNPAVVLADADLDHAADCIVDCGTALAGQKCTATRRVLVDERVADALLERLVVRIERLRVGDPRDERTDVGPLIFPEARDAAMAAVDAAVARGARREAAAVDVAEGPCVMAPMLLSNLADDDPLRTRELFAPVIAFEQFRTPADGFAAADSTPYGLSASIFGRDDELLAQAAARVRAGVLAINRRGDAVDLEAPFVGRKRSGNGHAEGGSYVYDSVTDMQAVYE